MRRLAILFGGVALISAAFGVLVVALGGLPDQYVLHRGEAVPGIEVPAGFEITVFLDQMAAPRSIIAHPEQRVIFVSERGSGRVLALRDENDDRIADEPIVVAQGLAVPSGLAFDAGWLYIAQADRVIRLRLGEDFKPIEEEVIIQNLPVGRNTSEVESGLHALLIHNDELYLSVGASCAGCEENDSRRAAVMVYNLDGSNERIFARGLYQVLGLATNPITGQLWVTSQGRPKFSPPAPEAIYALHNGDDAGWPRCIGGDLPDRELGGDDACAGVLQPLAELEAQSNVTGMMFLTHPSLPEEYRGDLLVVLHGGVIEEGREGKQSTIAVLRLEIDPSTGDIVGEPQEFVSGFGLSAEPGDMLGRPYDLTMTSDGTIFITDDAAGAVYELRYGTKF